MSLEPAPAPAPTVGERVGASLLRLRRRHRWGQLLLLLLGLLHHHWLLLLLLLLLHHRRALASRAFVRSGSAERATREGAHQRSTERMGRSRGTLGLHGGGDERFDASAEVVGFAASRIMQDTREQFSGRQYGSAETAPLAWQDLLEQQDVAEGEADGDLPLANHRVFRVERVLAVGRCDPLDDVKLDDRRIDRLTADAEKVLQPGRGEGEVRGGGGLGRAEREVADRADVRSRSDHEGRDGVSLCVRAVRTRVSWKLP